MTSKIQTVRKVRWGILATGGIAADFTRDLRLLPDAEVVAVGSRSRASAQAFADHHGIPRAHGSWAELAADPEVDIVYVATPHHAHHEAAALCLEAGKAVLCEKPLTLNAADSRALTGLARKRGVLLLEGMWMRFSPTVRRLVELIADGAIGEVATVHADFAFPGDFAPTHRLRDPALGGGALLDLGVYPVTFAHLLLGRPRSVSAWASLTPEGVDANTALLLGYDAGRLATLSCGITSATPCRAYVAGSHGRIELPPMFTRPDSFALHRSGSGSGPGQAVEPEVFRMPYAGAGFVHAAEEAMRCLREGLAESPLAPWQDTVEVMEILDTARAQIGVSYPGEP